MLIVASRICWFKDFVLTRSFCVMGKSSGSNSSSCKPFSGKCTLSRKRAGFPVVCSRKCKKCGEYRCRSHCLCARQGTAVGRCAPRCLPALTERKLSKTSSLPATFPTTTHSAAESLKPRGAPSTTTCKELSCEEWFQDLYSCLDAATEVELSTCMFFVSRGACFKCGASL